MKRQEDFHPQRFVSSEICLSCRGCCFFSRYDSPWRPKLTSREQKQIRVSFPSYIDSNGYLKLKASCHQEAGPCVFLRSTEHKCLIYPSRPWECALYPFVLTFHDGKYGLSAHWACPYIQEQHNSSYYFQYVRYLKSFFQTPGMISFLNQNSFLFGSYPEAKDELEELFPIKIALQKGAS